jgi:hypothetical protein
MASLLRQTHVIQDQHRIQGHSRKSAVSIRSQGTLIVSGSPSLREGLQVVDRMIKENKIRFIIHANGFPAAIIKGDDRRRLVP